MAISESAVRVKVALARIDLTPLEQLAIGAGLIYHAAECCRETDATLDARLKMAGAGRSDALLMAEIFLHHLNNLPKTSSESTAVEA